MEIRERIIQIRNSENLSMQSFADAIGVSVGVIKNIEYDKAPVTRVVCNAICYKFHIREQWLMDGVGDMYESDDLVDALANRRGMNGKQRALLDVFASLAPDEADLFYAVAQRVTSGVPVEDALPQLTAADLPPYVPPDQQQQKKLG